MGDLILSKIKKNKKHRTIVSFDEEIVTKDSVAKVLSEAKRVHENAERNLKDTENVSLHENNAAEINNTVDLRKKRKKKKSDVNSVMETNESGIMEKKTKRVKENKKQKKVSEMNEVIKAKNANDTVAKEAHAKEKKKKTQKTIKEVTEVERTEEPVNKDEGTVENSVIKNAESIRAQKKKKHAKLLDEKRLKAEVTAQLNALNYLSKWKHSRDEWKFEKLKQIWLQQNLFDISRLPEEFWDTVVEYFSGSKGMIRNAILKEALKTVEKEDRSEEENMEENYLLVLKRARDIVQNMQE